MARDLGLLALIPGESGGSRFTCAPAEIFAVVSHMHLLRYLPLTIAKWGSERESGGFGPSLAQPNLTHP
jgi:hypothetical protein